jgi:ASC-1-like (ASCH) protein
MKLTVQQQYFDLIKSWTKIYEWRLAKEKYRLLKIGDTITFSPNDWSECVEKVITSLHIYGSFAQAWLQLWVESIVPWIDSIDAMVSIYRNFYTLDDEVQYGVIMIGIQ